MGMVEGGSPACGSMVWTQMAQVLLLRVSCSPLVCCSTPAPPHRCIPVHGHVLGPTESPPGLQRTVHTPFRQCPGLSPASWHSVRSGRVTQWSLVHRRHTVGSVLAITGQVSAVVEHLACAGPPGAGSVSRRRCQFGARGSSCDLHSRRIATLVADLKMKKMAGLLFSPALQPHRYHATDIPIRTTHCPTSLQ